MSIVVATDFSPCSRAAARIGAALARRRSAPLILVHAVESPAFDVPSLPIGATGWERDMVMAAEVGIAHDESDIREDGTLVETSVLVGSAASVIAEVATDRRADLIIVGTHDGRRNEKHHSEEEDFDRASEQTLP